MGQYEKVQFLIAGALNKRRKKKKGKISLIDIHTRYASKTSTEPQLSRTGKRVKNKEVSQL